MSSKFIYYKKGSCQDGDIEEITLYTVDNEEKRLIYFGSDGSLNICIPSFKKICSFLILSVAFIPWYIYIFRAICWLTQK